MKIIISHIILIFFTGLTLDLIAQKNPTRIYIMTDRRQEYSYPRGSYASGSTWYQIDYADGSSEKATRKIRAILNQTVPGAQRELDLSRQCLWGQVGSAGLIGSGIFLTINSLSNENKPLAVTGGVVMVSGIIGVFHFWFKSRKHLEDYLNVCNTYFAKQNNNMRKNLGMNFKKIQPDEIKLGTLDSKIVGIGLTWNISN